MKIFILSIPICLLVSFAQAQTFFVEPTEKGFEKKILEKLKYDGRKTTDKKEESDYTIQSLITQTSKINSMYKGYIKIIDTKTGNEAARSKEVRRGAVAVNGFNAGNNIFEVIADKHLVPELKKIESVYKKPTAE
jgi:hypothetical protein